MKSRPFAIVHKKVQPYDVNVRSVCPIELVAAEAIPAFKQGDKEVRFVIATELDSYGILVDGGFTWHGSISYNPEEIRYDTDPRAGPTISMNDGAERIVGVIMLPPESVPQANSLISWAYISGQEDGYRRGAANVR